MALLTPANASWASKVVDWWSARDSNIVASGGVVQRVDSLVPGGKPMVCPSGREAVIVANDLNGYPALFLDANKRLETAGNSLYASPIGEKPYWFIGIWRGWRASGGGRWVDCNNGSGRPIIRTFPNGDVALTTDYNGFASYSTGDASTTGVRMLFCPFNNQATSTASYNGTAFASSASIAGRTSIMRSFGINGDSAGAESFPQWDYEWCWGTGELSDAQRQEAEGYLAWRWGVQGNLPAAHPYKAAAPQTAEAAGPISATVSVSLAALAGAGAGALPIVARADGATGPVAATASAALAVRGQGAGLVGLETTAASGILPLRATAASSLATLALVATANVVSGATGSVNATLLPAQGTAAASLPVRAGLAAPLVPLAASGAAGLAIRAWLASPLDPVGAQGSAVLTARGWSEASLGGMAVIAAATLTAGNIGRLSGSLGPVAGIVSASLTNTGRAAIMLGGAMAGVKGGRAVPLVDSLVPSRTFRASRVEVVFR